jgi:hypothetical protein
MHKELVGFSFHLGLQQFATQVGYITCLQTGGKLAAEDAYQQIQALYDQLQQVQP